MYFFRLKKTVFVRLAHSSVNIGYFSLSGQNIYTRSATRMASTNELHLERLFSVKDYVCVITGGGSGIGLMAAQGLSANGTCFLKLLRELLTTLKVQKYT